MSIILQGEIDEQHRLIIEIPKDVPIGKVEVEIRPTELPASPISHTEMDARLRAAGLLLEYADEDFPDGVEELTLEERQRIGTLKTGARLSDDLINEDRGLY
jgi:hypothetical protein